MLRDFSVEGIFTVSNVTEEVVAVDFPAAAPKKTARLPEMPHTPAAKAGGPGGATSNSLTPSQASKDSVEATGAGDPVYEALDDLDEVWPHHDDMSDD